jgi:stage V sporulation protein B
MKKVMGVGTVYLMFAKVIFVIANYGVHIGLARYLGPESYGIFGILMSLYLINSVFLNNGIPKAVSKIMAESRKKAFALFRVAIKLQFILSLFFAIGFILFAPLIALILKDNSLIHYIMFLGIMVIPISITSLYTEGYFNGLRMFKHQALVQSTHSILRVILVFLFVFFGFKIWGALFGYFLSVTLSVVMCRLMVKKKDIIKTKINSKPIIKFALPLTIASLAFTLMRNVNVLFIKSLLGENILVGLYTAAATLSSAPYMIFTALPLALMPSISMSVAAKSINLTRRYISESLRYMLLFLLPITVIVAATSKELITLFYSSTYASAAPVLSILIFSSIFLSLFATLVAVIVGSGKPKLYLIIILISIILLSILNIIAIPIFGIAGAAIALSLTSLLALSSLAVYIYLKYKVLIKIKSFIRILIASIIIFIITYFWHYSGILLLISYAVLMIIYFVMLFVMREINQEDFDLFKRSLKFKKKS